MFNFTNWQLQILIDGWFEEQDDDRLGIIADFLDDHRDERAKILRAIIAQKPLWFDKISVEGLPEVGTEWIPVEGAARLGYSYEEYCFLPPTSQWYNLYKTEQLRTGFWQKVTEVPTEIRFTVFWGMMRYYAENIIPF